MFQNTVKYHVILMLFLCNSCIALPNDQEQVMHVMADSADLNQLKHESVYIGHVELIQGSTNLRAAHAVTHTDAKNQLVLTVAKGQKSEQAHYWTIKELNKPPIHAYADVIRYHPLDHTIELVGRARVEQGDNSFSAEKIIYNTVSQQVLSHGDKKQRIMIIYHPQKKQKI